MIKQTLLSDMAARLAVKRAVLIALAGSLVLNLLLGTHIAQTKQTLQVKLEVPPRLSAGAWFTAESASPSAILDFAFAVTELALNVNPSTAQTQTDFLLHYAAPEYRPALEQAFASAREKLRADGASTVFWPASYSAEPNGYRIAISGTLATFINDRKITEIPRCYRIAMRWTQWRPALTEFTEVDPAKPFAEAAVAKEHS